MPYAKRPTAIHLCDIISKEPYNMGLFIKRPALLMERPYAPRPMYIQRDANITHIAHRGACMQRDLYIWKETYIYRKSVCKETYVCTKRPMYIKRDLYIWKETYIYRKSVCKETFAAREAFRRRGFDTYAPFWFNLYQYLEQNLHFGLVPENQF